MEPAYPIPLNHDEFAMLGELTAILGLVDEEMTSLVAELLSVERDTANAIMGSSKISDNASIWSKVVAEKVKGEEILRWLKWANTEMQEVSASRNDYIHAVFSETGIFDSDIFDSAIFDIVEVTARRVKRSNARPISELPKVILRAAQLSCIAAHISHLARGEPSETSPWHDKLYSSLPPHPDKGEARTAKGRRGPQKSSGGG